MDILLDKFLNETRYSYRTVYYPTDLMLYFEKHHMFEIIFDLMIMLQKDRPLKTEQYIAEHIVEIAKKYNQINTFLSLEDNEKTERLLQTFQRNDQYYPVIALQDSLASTFLQVLNDKLRHLKLQDKHIIMIGDRKTLTLAKKHFHFHQTLYVKNEKSLQKTYSYVTERIKLLQIDPHHSAITYGQRIVLLGRPGCGKHRVGKWLAEKLNICLAQHQRNYDCFGKALDCGSLGNVHTSELITSIVQHRLLQPDCIQNGWILLDFPNTADDITKMFQTMAVPKIVLVIDADESVCRRRKLSRRKSGQVKADCWQTMMFETELHFFNISHPRTLFALQKQQSCAVIHIDGNRSYSNIQNLIMDKLMIKKSL
ncbi:uncharacterized protein LOC121592202 isoform X3 [Anopheles merus]|uniref:uncharacterized protein LOC121592202 isoform X3 n=1 Tax=Anopheles merus TaxID=30066 RepID=UPI001BE3ED9C|nr:uncharacterized protein LOC121592202 isoform X3 [Anopheles merus]